MNKGKRKFKIHRVVAVLGLLCLVVDVLLFREDKRRIINQAMVASGMEGT